MLGKNLKERHPEIAQMYRQNGDGMLSYQEIAMKLRLPTRCHLKKRITALAVSYTLKGYDGKGEFTEPYEGLIKDRSELEILCKQHEINGSRKAGRYIVENKKGIHGMSEKRRRKLGRIRGLDSYLRKVGVHARTEEKMRDDGFRLVRSKGQTPWKERMEREEACYLSEIEIAARLADSLNYWYHKGFNRGRTNTSKIADKLNELFHNNESIRHNESVAAALKYYRKKGLLHRGRVNRNIYIGKYY